MKAFALSYCIFFVMFGCGLLEILLLSEGKWRWVSLDESRGRAGAGRSGGTGNCGPDVLYERRISFQLKIK